MANGKTEVKDIKDIKETARTRIQEFIDAVSDGKMLPKHAILNVSVRTTLNRKAVKAAQADGATLDAALKAGTSYNTLVRLSLPVPPRIKAAVEEYLGGGMNDDTSVLEILDTITLGGKTNKVEVKYL